VSYFVAEKIQQVWLFKWENVLIRMSFFSNCVWELTFTLLKELCDINSALSDLLLLSEHILNCTFFSDTDIFLNIRLISLHAQLIGEKSAWLEPFCKY